MKMLVVTDLSFPTGSAMASRIKSFCMLFKELGYDIHVIAAKSGNKEIEYNKIYNDVCFSYEVVPSNRSEQIQSFIGNENLVKKVDEYLNNNNVDLVFFNSLGALFNKILKICNKHNVKTLLEQCEWYDCSGFRFGKNDIRYIRFNKNIENNFIKVNGVISISRLLHDYYLSKKVKTIRIPSLFDVSNIEYKTDIKNEKIKLIYAGSVGKSKELLKPILQALSKDEYKNKVSLDIYGITKEQVLNNIANDSSLIGENIIVHGRVDYSELKEALINSNYQIFIKPERRSSNAQFPTKLAESMSYGTPVICNNTGDISLYLQDGCNGFICDANDLTETFDRILNVKDDEYANIRFNARKTAEESFDYRNYLNDVKEFIEKL